MIFFLRDTLPGTKFGEEVCFKKDCGDRITSVSQPSKASLGWDQNQIKIVLPTATSCLDACLFLTT
jgi:hypothetical protein